MSKKYLMVAKKYAKKISDCGSRVWAMYLFGSRVRGTNRLDSDLDVCVVSDDFTDDMVENRVRLMRLVGKRGLLIEPHPMKVEDFEDKYNPLAMEVKRTGIRVV